MAITSLNELMDKIERENEPLLLKEHWPTCFKCNKVVDNCLAYDNYQADAIRLEAYCHDEMEMCEMSREEIRMYKLERGFAFIPNNPETKLIEKNS